MTGRLENLHRRYDGPIPREARIEARYGSRDVFELCVARSDVRFFAAQTALASRRLRTLSRHQAPPDPIRAATARADLAFYRRQHGRWCRYLGALRRPQGLGSPAPDSR